MPALVLYRWVRIWLTRLLKFAALHKFFLIAPDSRDRWANWTGNWKHWWKEKLKLKRTLPYKTQRQWWSSKIEASVGWDHFTWEQPNGREIKKSRRFTQRDVLQWRRPGGRRGGLTCALPVYYDWTEWDQTHTTARNIYIFGIIKSVASAQIDTDLLPLGLLLWFSSATGASHFLLFNRDCVKTKLACSVQGFLAICAGRILLPVKSRRRKGCVTIQSLHPSKEASFIGGRVLQTTRPRRINPNPPPW